MTDHYFTKLPDSPFIKKKIVHEFLGEEYTFFTAPGVFSKDKIDNGSEIMVKQFLKHEEVQLNSRILDLGCGYGYVGILLSRMISGVKVSFVDVNQRALFLARSNASENNIVDSTFHDIDFADSRIVEEFINQEFDYVLFNPPIKAGRPTIEMMLENTKRVLASEGKLYAVIKKSLGAKSWQTWFEGWKKFTYQVFKKGGYWIFLLQRIN